MDWTGIRGEMMYDVGGGRAKPRPRPNKGGEDALSEKPMDVSMSFSSKADGGVRICEYMNDQV